MPYDSKKEKAIEWSARILLTIHFFRSMSGFIIYWQTKYQLVSPLIPKSIVTEISEPYFKASLLIGASLIFSLWFYFFRMRMTVILISAISILSFELLADYFAK